MKVINSTTVELSADECVIAQSFDALLDLGLSQAEAVARLEVKAGAFRDWLLH